MSEFSFSEHTDLYLYRQILIMCIHSLSWSFLQNTGTEVVTYNKQESMPFDELITLLGNTEAITDKNKSK